jgi:hypothetical protein
MRTAVIAMLLTFVVAGSFAATTVILNRTGGPAPISPRAPTAPVALSIQPSSTTLIGYPGAEIIEEAGGVRLKSTFSSNSEANAAADLNGSAYYTLTEARIPRPATKRLTIVFDVSIPEAAVGHEMAVRYVENGLNAGPWERIRLARSRFTYSILWTQGPDTRPSPKTDTLFLRSDAQGRGREIKLHAIQIVPAP